MKTISSKCDFYPKHILPIFSWFINCLYQITCLHNCVRKISKTKLVCKKNPKLIIFYMIKLNDTAHLTGKKMHEFHEMTSCFIKTTTIIAMCSCPFIQQYPMDGIFPKQARSLRKWENTEKNIPIHKVHTLYFYQ